MEVTLRNDESPFDCKTLGFDPINNPITGCFMMCMGLSSDNIPGSIDLSNFDTSQVTDMAVMFYGCSTLTSLDLSNFDTSQVTNMYQMFAECISLTSLDLSNFDTSSLIESEGDIDVFAGCSNLQSIEVTNCTETTINRIKTMLQQSSLGVWNQVTEDEKIYLRKP